MSTRRRSSGRVLVGVACSVLAVAGLIVAEPGRASLPTKPRPKSTRLPFQTIAKGTDVSPPFQVGPPTPAALIAARYAGWVQVNVYAGLFDRDGYSMAISNVSLVNGRLQVKAALTVPEHPAPGFSSPYQFIRIKQSALHGKAPQSSYLVQVESRLRPQTSVARLTALARKVGGKLVSATLARRYETVQPWTSGGSGVVLSYPVWYLRCVGNLHFGLGLSPTGYYLVNDQTGHAFGGGYP